MSYKEDTHAWLQVSATEYSQAAPVNFGAERIGQISKVSGIDTNARANAIDPPITPVPQKYHLQTFHTTSPDNCQAWE
jgi:hypothetical protein